jgi:hypothetical protein
MKIKQFLPKKEFRPLFQGRMEKGLYQELLAKLRRDKVKHRDFLEAAAKAFISEGK